MNKWKCALCGQEMEPPQVVNGVNYFNVTCGGWCVPVEEIPAINASVVDGNA